MNDRRNRKLEQVAVLMKILNLLPCACISDQILCIIMMKKIMNQLLR